MSLLLIEGFHAHAGNINNGTNVTTQVTQPKWTQALYTVWNSVGISYVVHSNAASASGTVNTYDMLYKALAVADQDDVLVIGFHVIGQSIPRLTLRGDSNATTHIQIASSGSELVAYRGTVETGTLLGTTVGADIKPISGSPVVGDWRFIEVEIKLHDSTGYVKIWSQGVKVLDFSGDTKNGGTASVFDSVAWRNSPGAFIDDIYILNEQGSVNNARLGVVRVDTIEPNANGSNSEWTGSDGNSTDNYALVEDLDTSAWATDYVSANTDPLTDTYNYPSIPTLNPQEAVLGVQHTFVAQKQDAGGRTVAPVCISGGTTDVGADSALINGTPQTITKIYELDPNTSAAWTEANLNAAEFGYRSRP